MEYHRQASGRGFKRSWGRLRWAIAIAPVSRHQRPGRSHRAIPSLCQALTGRPGIIYVGYYFCAFRCRLLVPSALASSQYVRCRGRLGRKSEE